MLNIIIITESITVKTRQAKINQEFEKLTQIKLACRGKLRV